MPSHPLFTQLMENFLALMSALIAPLLSILRGGPRPRNKAMSPSSATLPTGRAALSPLPGAWPLPPPPTPAPPTPCPHSPWGVGSLGLCLDGGPGAPQEGLGSAGHSIVVAVERGAVARGGEGAVAPRRRSAPRGAQVVAPAGAGERLRPMRIGGCASWRRDVREAAVEREAQGQPGPQPLPGPHLQGGRRQQRSPRGERWGATCRLGRSTPSR